MLPPPSHLVLGTQTRAIAADGDGRERATTETVADGCVARGEIAVDGDVVPTLGMSDVTERDDVVLTPEEWNGVEALVRAEDVAGSRLLLALRCNPGRLGGVTAGSALVAEGNSAPSEVVR